MCSMASTALPACSARQKGVIAQRGGVAPTTSHSEGMQLTAPQVCQAPGGKACTVPGQSTARRQSGPPKLVSVGSRHRWELAQAPRESYPSPQLKGQADTTLSLQTLDSRDCLPHPTPRPLHE